jgi:hypothetical protein
LCTQETGRKQTKQKQKHDTTHKKQDDPQKTQINYSIILITDVIKSFLVPLLHVLPVEL